MKNLKFSKKRISSFFLAMGISIFSHNSLADVISYNNKTTLTNGKEATVYFITGTNDSDYAYVSFDNLVGYIPLNNINVSNLTVNNDYYAVEKKMTIEDDSAYIYLKPDMNETVINTLYRNDTVYVTAKNNDGWYIVSGDNYTGFLHESAFKIPNNKTSIIQITGRNVNVRTMPNTNSKNNIIGQVNTGDIFTLINHEYGWYMIDYYGQNAYISDSYGMELLKDSNSINSTMQVNMVKITGNNVNIRSSASAKSSSNIIGFADVTDYFRIIDKENDWYVIDYFGERAYVNNQYANERLINQEDTRFIKMICLTQDAAFYSDTNGTYMTTLPYPQYAGVIKEENGYYRIMVDGVIGYVDKHYTNTLTSTFIISDLGRQIVKVYQNNKEVYRTHEITGLKEEQTDIGIFTVGHKMQDYQLTPIRRVDYWIQYNDNEGFHDAKWQKDEYFVTVARDAYERFSKGLARTYPISHGSQGCDNLKLIDAMNIYNLLSIGDNVIVVGPNSLIRDNLISKAYEQDNQKVKMLVQ